MGVAVAISMWKRIGKGRAHTRTISVKKEVLARWLENKKKQNKTKNENTHSFFISLYRESK